MTPQDKESWRSLLNLFQNAENSKQLDELFHLFFTLNERHYLVDRYNIVKALLTTEMTQREIAKELNVSISKITLGSKEVQTISEKLKRFLVCRMQGGKR